MRFLKLYFFFSKSPGLDLMVLFFCTLFILLIPNNPSRTYDILKNGVVVKADLTDVGLTPIKNFYVYQFKTRDGVLIKSNYASIARPEDFKIDSTKTPNTIEVRYVPARPENHWLDSVHSYHVETFWRDYVIDNVMMIAILYLIIKIGIRIDRIRRIKERI